MRIKITQFALNMAKKDMDWHKKMQEVLILLEGDNKFILSFYSVSKAQTINTYPWASYI